MKQTLLFTAALLLITIACQSHPPRTEAPQHVSLQQIYDQIKGQKRSQASILDPAWCESLQRNLNLGEECIRPDEAQHYAELGQRVQAVQAKMPDVKDNQVDRTGGDGGLRRTLHTKAHACVKGFLTPASNRSTDTFAGLFAAKAATRPAWIRFSNAKGIVENDNEQDARGMAIKVMGVDASAGQRMQPGWETQTQDFLMTNKPRGTTRNADDFVGFLEASADGPVSEVAFFTEGRVEELAEILRVSSRKIDSVAKETYWSGGSFLWGQKADGTPRAVKFKMQPTACVSAKEKMASVLAADLRPENPAPGYLKEDLKSLLAQGDLCFNLSIQVQKNPSKQPIEDGFVLWDESDTAPIPVATLRIPHQSFDSDKQYEMCEHMTFSPWNGSAAHRPLGDLNRARRAVYGASQSQRLSVMPPMSAKATTAAVEPHPNDIYWNLNPFPKPINSH